MRKIQKRQTEDAIKLLSQAHIQIRNAIERKENIIAMQLLQQCQEAAIELGNMIEDTEGEDFTTIHLVESYCEIVYTSYEKLRQTQFINKDKIYKNLHKSLIQIENSVKNDIKVHIEVVFLPYKAAMWDSLESVWIAANEDPDCDAYVIPIPYYDKNFHGEFKELHYEGSMYPDYVPITDYRTYDFEQRYPDMIFIHNPYDEYNYVTSVHPFFYSKNLKRFTDKLVYSPYFIHQNHYVAEHYCMSPGVIYAQKVILQSQKVKEQYKKYYISAMKKVENDKFLALGSPKLDRNYKEKIIPEEWNEFLYRDGVRRKILFLNTHLVCLMQNYDEDFFLKITQIFDYFRQNPKVLLLWRPHPLSLATTDSMNPRVKNRYLDLVEKYKKEKFGIYDDSSDIHRAVEISDAYYGNKSSVIEMFLALGKPVMIMNLHVYEGENKHGTI